MKQEVVNALTIDVEEWFHILGVDSPPVAEWPQLSVRVDRNVDRILGLLEEYGVRGTFFILGWIAEQHPEIARCIASHGHEIASHGYGHELVYNLDYKSFHEDIRSSVDVIYSASGTKPVAYRAPGFSITPDTAWAFDVLKNFGFMYDSSLNPVPIAFGGFPGINRLPHKMRLPAGGSLLEYPVSLTRIMGRNIPYSGGGYLRLLPYRFLRSRIMRANQRGEPVMVYLHPRDIDPDQPRLPMHWRQRFKSYNNLDTTMDKLQRLLSEFRFGTLSESFCTLDNQVPESVIHEQ